MRLAVHLILGVIFGIIAALIASNKGRNAVGWFFGGFFLGLIGVIIVACLGNLKQQAAYRARAESERHRLREQLRQERLKTEAYRQYSMDRIDAHDKVLGVDTRPMQSLPGGASSRYLPGNGPATSQQAASALHRLAGDTPPAAHAPTPGSAERALYDLSAAGQASAPAESLAQTPWYYESGGEAKGPVSASSIKQLLEKKAINGSTLLWAEGLSDWTPASQVVIFRPVVDS